MRFGAILMTGVAVAALAGAAQAGPNLVTNGDFQAGVTGFTSGYTYSPGNLQPETAYDVVSDPFNDHPLWASFFDHTLGTSDGLMLAVNGGGDASDPFWQEASVAVTADTNYTFTYWVAANYPTSPGQILASIDGTQVGSTFTVTTTTGQWEEVTGTWFSGANINANLAMFDENTAASGNDFSIDDISLTSSVPEPAAWALMLAGFGAIGGAMRRRRLATVAI